MITLTDDKIYKTVLVTIEVDPVTWATEYEIDPDKVADDVTGYLDSIEVATSLHTLNAFGPVPKVKFVEVRDTKPTFLLMGQMCWGQGETLNEAKANFRKQGGSLTQGYTLFTFDKGTQFLGVDQMGRYSWNGTEPEVQKVPALSGSKRGKR